MMFFCVRVLVGMALRMVMTVITAVTMVVMMILTFDIHIEFDTTDMRTFNLVGINGISTQIKLCQLAAQIVNFDAQRDQSADNHVAAGSRKTIKVETLHKFRPSTLLRNRTCDGIEGLWPCQVR